jgi:hypothetical protein
MDTELLIQRVARVIQDASFSDDDILAYINEGLAAVSGEVPLPALEVETEVATDPLADNIALPTDFQTHLRFVYSQTRRRQVRILSNLVRLREVSPAIEGGLVRRVAVSGGRLFYAPTPAEAEPLDLIYHAKPTPYEGLDDETDYIPVHIGHRILQAYACKEIYELIEDGVEGQKINTAKWEQKYVQQLQELIMFLGPLYNRPVGEMETFNATGF